jgi:hypothetical protein
MIRPRIGAVVVGLLCGCWATGSGSRSPTGDDGGGQAKARVRPFQRYDQPTGDPYVDRFVALWNDLHDPKNGYFSPKGVPYHAPETMVVEAPDYGHETTSEAYSYWIWLEAMYGRVAGDWSYLADAWANAEAYIIPGEADQPSVEAYDPDKPGEVTPELDEPSQYPAALQPTAPVGRDPIAGELRAAYGTSAIYGMHWLLDVDDWYGFGQHGDGTARPSCINTFQRGPRESVWEAIPQPCWDGMRWGGPHGYLDLFVKDSDVAQWKYADAPDADARAIEAAFWALRWAQERGGGALPEAVAPIARKAARLGDYLRYALFDKYFKPLGCASPGCPAGDGRSAGHYLIGWYYAWGAPTPPGSGWSWRIGSSWVHSGYQNPMAAYALAMVPEMRPRSAQGANDWNRSLGRQLALYRWLQSAEGGIAGGVTNSIGGAYGARPPGTPAFYGMTFDPSPVYRDPPSNEWFGFQTWSMERVAEYYYVTADSRAEQVLRPWVAWVLANVRFAPDGGYAIPASLDWTGQPAGSIAASSPSDAPNAALHVAVRESGNDPGVAGSVARALAFWAARSRDVAARTAAKELLDRMWAKYRDAKGVAAPEVHKEFTRFRERVVVPPGWRGTMPDGDAIDASSTFLSIRSRYAKDPSWPQVDAYLRGGPPPTFVVHRFWAQAEIALANATYGWLFPERRSPQQAAAAVKMPPGAASASRR